MNEKIRSIMEILFGTSTLTIVFHDAYPVLSFIAVLCGAILGIHGVYSLIRGKPHNIHNIYSEGTNTQDHNHHGNE